MDEFYKNLKRHLLTASLVGLVVAVSSSANAAFQFNLLGTANFYIGAGLAYNKYLISKEFASVVESASNNGKMKSNSLSVAPVLGLQINNKYGLELGYSLHNNLKYSGVQAGNLRIRNFFVDAMGYLPLESYPIDLLAGAGIGRMNIKMNSSLNAMGTGDNYNKFGFRVKGGMQYAVDPNWSVRGLLVYQRVGDRGGKHAIKTMRSITFDAIYLI